MVFNATFNNISFIGQFYWWRKPEDPEKTTDLSQVTDKTMAKRKKTKGQTMIYKTLCMKLKIE
jgi:hypothetical protein